MSQYEAEQGGEQDKGRKFAYHCLNCGKGIDEGAEVFYSPQKPVINYNGGAYAVFDSAGCVGEFTMEKGFRSSLSGLEKGTTEDFEAAVRKEKANAGNDIALCVQPALNE